MIPKTPPELRRRLDRLARRAHAFHRFAHHPLCAEYADERIQVGRIRLCRGCALLAAGAGAGLLLGAFLPAHRMVAGLALVLAAFAGVCAFALRLPKIAGRALPGAALAFALVQGLRLGLPGWMLSAGSASLFVAAFVLYRRRGPHRGPCETCPERDR
ncbi:MAG TPA: hypothetical protein VNV60_08780, partial [Holophagaceae bacterium]|nr:hypothetical protein [Holophagaceae bacterium]